MLAKGDAAVGTFDQAFGSLAQWCELMGDPVPSEESCEAAGMERLREAEHKAGAEVAKRQGGTPHPCL